LRALLGESDCCRKVGSILVLIDAKAYSVPRQYDRGQYSAIMTRNGYVRDWIAQADRLTDRLAANPVGDNYDLVALGVTHVLTIVATPYTEYIPERRNPFFLDPQTPRVALPSEIRDFLRKTTASELAANPNTRAVVSNG
jgi:hypothetical protein